MSKKYSVSKISLLSLFVLALLFIVPTAYAFDGRSGERVVIGADEVVEDDLYISATEIVFDGVVKGDLIVVGRTLEINGVVEGDLWAAGQSITVNGQVEDDVRFAGAALTLGNEAQVGGDLLAGSYSLETQPASQVGGDLLLGAFQGLLAGSVEGDAQAGVNRLTVDGTVRGNLRADIAPLDRSRNWNPNIYMEDMPVVPPVPAGLNLGDEASIGGSLVYTSPDTLSIPESQVSGEIQHVIPSYDLEREVQVTPQAVRANWLMDNFRRLVALSVVGLLLVLVLPGLINRSASALQANPLPSFGWGLVSVLIFPILVLMTIALIVVLALVMGALTLGNLVGVISSLGAAFVISILVIFGFVLAYLAKVVVGYQIGRLLLSRINPDLVVRPFWPVLVGVVILAVLLAIPILGGLINVVITLLGLGALFLLFRDRYLVQPRPVPVTPTLPE